MDRIDSKTRIAALFGNPVAHSLSPLFMNESLARLRVNCVYLAVCVEEEHLGGAIEAIRAVGMAGVNVTIPFKRACMRYLDTIDENAARIGAVNCIEVRGSSLTGHNTDCTGFLAPIDKTGVTLDGAHALVAGAGGAARAVVYGLLESGVGRVLLANRTPGSALRLVEWAEDLPFSGKTEYIGDASRVTQKLVNETAIVVNTTPVGQHPHVNESPFPGGIHFKPGQIVYDLVYNPRETRLLASAKADGAFPMDGLRMLVSQGMESLGIWFPDRRDAIGNLSDFCLTLLSDKTKVV